MPTKLKYVIFMLAVGVILSVPVMKHLKRRATPVRFEHRTPIASDVYYVDFNSHPHLDSQNLTTPSPTLKQETPDPYPAASTQTLLSAVYDPSNGTTGDVWRAKE